MIQPTVVTAVVVRAVLAKTTGPVPENGTVHRNSIEEARAIAMAEISLHALILHQYQRSK
jgi:hypothetical protein